MSVTPESDEAKTISNLRNMIGDSQTFRAIVGVDSQEEAFAFIHGSYALDDATADVLGDPDEEGEQNPYPRAVINFDDDDFAKLLSTTGWSEQKAMSLLLEFEPPEDVVGRWDQQIWFLNQIGEIRAELKGMSTKNPGAGPYIALKELHRRYFGCLDPSKNNGKIVWAVEYQLVWKGGSA